MQKTIYFKNGVHERIQKLAEKNGVSVSNMIASKFPDVFIGNKVVDPSAEVFNRLDKLESKIESLISEMDKKIDLLIPKGMPKGLKDGRKTTDALSPGGALRGFVSTGDLTEAELEAKNKELHKKQKAAKKEKPKKLIKTSTDARDWVGSFSKEKQLGKGGK